MHRADLLLVLPKPFRSEVIGEALLRIAKNRRAKVLETIASMLRGKPTRAAMPRRIVPVRQIAQARIRNRRIGLVRHRRRAPMLQRRNSEMPGSVSRIYGADRTRTRRRSERKTRLLRARKAITLRLLVATGLRKSLLDSSLQSRLLSRAASPRLRAPSSLSRAAAVSA